MYHEYLYARRHKENFPAHQPGVSDLEDWMKNLRSVNQHTYGIEEIRLLKRGAMTKVEFPAMESDMENLSSRHGLSDEKRREYEA